MYAHCYRFQSSKRLSGKVSPFLVTSHPVPVDRGHLYLSKNVHSERTDTFIRKSSCDFSCQNYNFNKQNTSEAIWPCVASGPTLAVPSLGPVAPTCPHWGGFWKGYSVIVTVGGRWTRVSCPHIVNIINPWFVVIFLNNFIIFVAHHVFW